MRPLEIILIILIILFVGGITAWRVCARVLKKRSGNSDGSCGCGCDNCAERGKCPAAKSFYTTGADENMPETPVRSDAVCSFEDIVKNMTDSKKVDGPNE